MGGNAFKQYDTPRLPWDQYGRLRALAQKQLEPLFEGVSTPPSDPDKTSHGDVDFVVHNPKEGADPQAVAAALQAVDLVVALPTSNYVVPFNDAYAQVDVHRCVKEHHEMRVFLNSYGRLGHLLCAMILRFGLFLDMRGLWTAKPAPATPAFLLTASLEAVLDLLHLPLATYLAGFSSRQQIWEWFESGNIAGIPLIRGWRGASAKSGDGMMEEWAARRAGQEKVEIDKEAVRAHILSELGKKEEYQEWETRLAEEAKEAERLKIRAEKVREEVTRRLALSTAKGKEIKAEAKHIRAEVEAEYAEKEATS